MRGAHPRSLGSLLLLDPLWTVSSLSPEHRGSDRRRGRARREPGFAPERHKPQKPTSSCSYNLQNLPHLPTLQLNDSINGELIFDTVRTSMLQSLPDCPIHLQPRLLIISLRGHFAIKPNKFLRILFHSKTKLPLVCYKLNIFLNSL